MIRDEITKLLEKYKDLVAFNPSEMPSIPPHIMEYKLCVDLNHKSVI